MSLLEVVTKALAEPKQHVNESKYPIILNSDPILLSLKPQNEESNDASLAKRATGWQVGQTDTEIIELGQKFFKKLKKKLKNPITFNKDEFIKMFNSFLEKNGSKVGISVGVDKSSEDYTRKLVEKLGFSIGKNVLGLILEVCIVLELWDLLEDMIVNGLVDHCCSSDLVSNLIEKKRSDLVCSCIKHFSDLHTIDILHVLKHFLSLPKEGHDSMSSVRNEWESQALSAIEQVADKKLSGKKLTLAKEASILLMMAHDGFSASELCLHYLLALSNIDEVILASCISKLDGNEMIGLIRYLNKWMKKYEKFPQAVPCPKASSSLGLKACDWVPSLENIAKCLGLVVDEHFSSLVLHPEFHEELRSMEEVVHSLASETRECFTVADLAENLRASAKG